MGAVKQCGAWGDQAHRPHGPTSLISQSDAKCYPEGSYPASAGTCPTAGCAVGLCRESPAVPAVGHGEETLGGACGRTLGVLRKGMPQRERKYKTNPTLCLKF